MFKKVKYSLLATCCMALALSACKKDKDTASPGTYYGDSVQYGQGVVRSFVTLGSDDKPSSIGLTFSKGMLNGLPTDTTSMMANMITLKLPAEAQATGFDHIEVNWNPFGHPPAPYLIPHFDFHFYLVSAQEQAAVKGGPDTVKVAPQYIPLNYEDGVVAVPDMGVHWVDSLAPEFHGHAFTNTFIYGFYQGQLYFVEPMVSRPFLETMPDVITSIKQPAAFQKHGYYPTQWHVKYDAATQSYTVALEDLQYH